MEWREGGGSAAALRGMSGVPVAGVEVGVMWLAAAVPVSMAGVSTGVDGGVEEERVSGEGGGVEEERVAGEGGGVGIIGRSWQ